eukprot:m.267986 g.267986  ORF g.267986 m.267986 type:complete len:498 (+) comp75725_c0_seq1:313-1806(+)
MPRTVTSPDVGVAQMFETLKLSSNELKGTQALTLPSSRFQASEVMPERLKSLLLPGQSPMAQDALKARLHHPEDQIEPQFDGVERWYADQVPKDQLYSTSDWKAARTYVKERATNRRTLSVGIRETSERLRTTGDSTLLKKSIKVKTTFIDRIEELGEKSQKLKQLKKQVDTELKMLSMTIKGLDEFNQNRFAWPFKANNQCLRNRAKRIGIDLVADDVDFQLKREKDMLEHVSDDLEKAFNQAVDHSEMMQDCSQQLGDDLTRKAAASKTDTRLEKLKSTSESLNLHVKTLQQPPKNSRAYLEWLSQTDGLEAASKELIVASKKMRQTIAKMQEETDQKVRAHDNDCMNAIRKRTTEYQEAIDENRSLLISVKHEIATVLDELKSCCEMVEAQEGPLKRTTTRLKKRESGRTPEERTIDTVHSQLLQEAADLTQTVETLQQEIATHNANLEELRQMEAMLEEDLMIKHNSFKIEKKCTYARSYFCRMKNEKAQEEM